MLKMSAPVFVRKLVN